MGETKPLKNKAVSEVNYRPLVSSIKYYRTFAFIWFFLMILIIYFLSKLRLFVEYPILDYVFFIGGLFLFYAVFSLFKKNRFEKIDSILADSCDPDAYIKTYGNILRSLSNANISGDQGGFEVNSGFELYWLNICDGIIASGDFKGALKVLSGFKFYGRDRAEKSYDVICESCLCSVCLNLGETGRASAHLERLKELLLRNKFKKLELEQYWRFCYMLQFRIGMANGSYENAEPFFTEMFLTAKNNYERVQAKYYLGEVYLHGGDALKARDAFDFVIANGNKLHMVEEAKEKLTQMG